VHAVLAGRLPFLGIAAVVAEALEKVPPTRVHAFETLYDADREARAAAAGLIGAHA
jgi:1-deoxy-D-xylulose-5-phosphate reductoisomerase